MSSSIDILSKKLYKTLSEKEDKQPKPADDQATVTKIDGDIVWVKIPGGIDETPVRRTVSAKPGDVVQVRRSGGRAWITGNATNPPTDDTQANIATRMATGAEKLSEIAAKAAADAQESAGVAYSYADQAKTSAEQADENAKSASKSATSALYGLSTVQDVVGTLNWIEENQDYIWAGESEFDPNATYYTTNTRPNNAANILSLDIINNKGYTVVFKNISHGSIYEYYGYYKKIDPIESMDKVFRSLVNDSDDPSTWYLADRGHIYEKTNNIYNYLYTVDRGPIIIPPHTTFYIIEIHELIVPGVDDPEFWLEQADYVIPTFTKVKNPVADELPLYYTADTKTSMANYIKSHLALNDDGLYVMQDGSGWKYKVTNEGAYILDPGNIPKAIYKTDVQLGNDLDPHRMILSALALSFFFNQKLVGKFGYDEMFESYGLYAENVLIKGAGNALRLDNAVNGTYQGQYILETRANGHISLKPGLSRTEED